MYQITTVVCKGKQSATATCLAPLVEVERAPFFKPGPTSPSLSLRQLEFKQSLSHKKAKSGIFSEKKIEAIVGNKEPKIGRN